MAEAAPRPAFYALAPGGWRDYATLLHPPYTLWHLSYVVIGAAIAPDWRPGRLGLALAAFFLGLGVGAHALDELNGRPLRTRIPRGVLVALAGSSLAAAAGLGVYAAVAYDLWLLVFVGAGAFLACAYNLEWFGGRFHGDPWFSLAWGALPLLTAYFNAAERIRAEAVVAAGFAALLSHAQRLLSTPARRLRREVGAAAAAAAPEAALRALAAAVVLLAVSLVLVRVS
jgi:hypothetical protein